MKQLNPKSIWLFFIGYLLGVPFTLLLISLAVLTFAMNDIPKHQLDQIREKIYLPWYILFILFLFKYWIIVLIFLVILGYIWAYLTWYYYKYELREEGFRKEHGVIWKKYVTIPYARIQNVDIYRGPISRILGLSDLQIQTAGMSGTMGSYGGGAEGRLPGLLPEEAEKLRDELIRRAAAGKNQGL